MSYLSGILLVDDDQTTNFLNRLLLQRANVTEHVLVAEDGRQALQVLEAGCALGHPQCPELILLDVNMPGMNGLEFLTAYQQLPQVQQRGIVIVMLTTSLLTSDLARFERLPVAGVLDKPLTQEKLHRLLAQHFPDARAGR